MIGSPLTEVGKQFFVLFFFSKNRMVPTKKYKIHENGPNDYLINMYMNEKNGEHTVTISKVGGFPS